MDEIKKKKPKADRMHDHIVDSCRAEGKPAATCDTMAWAVVNKWKSNHKKKRGAKATPMTKKD